MRDSRSRSNPHSAVSATARLGCSGPATQAQERRDLDRERARRDRNVRPVATHREAPPLGRGPVSEAVTNPARPPLVAQPSIDLEQEVLGLVEVVTPSRAAQGLLPSGDRQAMGSFDIANVPDLGRALGARSEVCEALEQDSPVCLMRSLRKRSDRLSSSVRRSWQARAARDSTRSRGRRKPRSRTVCSTVVRCGQAVGWTRRPNTRDRVTAMPGRMLARRPAGTITSTSSGSRRSRPHASAALVPARATSPPM